MPGLIRSKIHFLIATLLLAGVAGSAALAQEPMLIPPGVEVLTLDKAIDLALINNRSAKNARLETEKSDDRTAAARTHLLPVFKLNAGISKPLSTFDTTFEKGVFGTSPSGPIPNEDTVITSSLNPTAAIVGQLQQPLSQLHRIKLQIKQQEMAGEISRAQLNATEQALVNEVKRAYYAILQSQGAAQAAEANLKLYRELDRVTGEYVVQQVVLKTELMDVQTRLAKAEYELLTVQNQWLAQREQLNHLLGRDVRTEFAVSSGDETALAVMRETDLVSARERALANRPEVREAKLRIEQAKLDKRIKKSEFIPDVSLTVNYATTFSYSNFVPRSLSGVGVQVEWEVFDWGRKKREVAEKGKSIDQASNSLLDAESEVLMEVNTRFRQMQESRQLLKVAKLAQTQARANVQMVTYKYRLDAVLLKDVLQAQTVMTNSDYDYQKALLTFWTAKADFEKAIGESK
ncbi:MAG TPA: TolC family protein [Pyrinomonadaceae bacterium]|nr:TolC family protein [Pyrinomonadaceae bacterium]